ncbi:hypothetical protein DFH09DRAFT_1157202, partial [Mycena vulgaris]
QDLIDAIMDEVAAKPWAEPKDYATLSACAVVARAFLAPSQRHLYRTITLRSETVADIASTFTASPHLASYVRDLHIDVPFGIRPSSYDNDRYPASRPMTEHSPLASLFPLLNGLQRLTIEECNWNDLPATSRGPLAILFTIPSLRCVALVRCRGVPSYLVRRVLCCASEVILRHVYVDPEDGVLPYADGSVGIVATPIATLQHLTLEYRADNSATLHALFLGGTPANRLENVRHLELGPGGGSMGGLDRIALKCADPIEHLSIHFKSRSHVRLSS